MSGALLANRSIQHHYNHRSSGSRSSSNSNSNSSNNPINSVIAGAAPHQRPTLHPPSVLLRFFFFILFWKFSLPHQPAPPPSLSEKGYYVLLRLPKHDDCPSPPRILILNNLYNNWSYSGVRRPVSGVRRPVSVANFCQRFKIK